MEQLGQTEMGCGSALAKREGGLQLALMSTDVHPGNLSQFSLPYENLHMLNPEKGYWLFQEAASLLCILALLFHCVKQTNIIWSGN